MYSIDHIFTGLILYFHISRRLASLSHRIKSLPLSGDVHFEAMERCDHLSHVQIYWFPLKYQCPVLIILKARWLILLGSH